MKPFERITLPRLTLCGFSFYGDPFSESAEWTEENEIGRLWSRFFEFYGNNIEKMKSNLKTEKFYEAHITHPDTEKKGFFEIFIGAEIIDYRKAEKEMLLKVFPESNYAKYTLEGREIISDYEKELDFGSFGELGYKAAGGYGLQVYDHRFKGMDKIDESVIDVLVPLVKLQN